MDLNIDEQRLIAEFRRLSPAAREELLDFASLLRKRQEEKGTGEAPTPSDRCTIDRREDRPKADREPLFTE